MCFACQAKNITSELELVGAAFEDLQLPKEVSAVTKAWLRRAITAANKK